MLVSAKDRVFVERLFSGQEYSAEFKQSTYETIADLADDIPDEATKIYLLKIDKDEFGPNGQIHDMTEDLANAWLVKSDEYEIVTEYHKKPVYVKNSTAWVEYAHENRDSY